MEIKIPTFYSIAIFIVCLFVSISIINDQTGNFIPGYLFILPLAHGAIQCIRRNVENPITLLVKFTYFVRNVITPYLLIDTGYQVPFFSINNQANLITTIILYVLETLLVFAVIYYKTGRGKKKGVREKTSNIRPVFSINNTILYKCSFVFLFILMLLLLMSVPHTDMVTRTIFDEDAFVSFNSDMELLSVGRSRTLLSVYSYLVDTFRIILPAYLLVTISKIVKKPVIAVFLSFMVLMLEFFVITERTMTTLIIIVVLGFLIVNLYPSHRRVVVRMIGAGVFLLFCLILGLKLFLDEEGGDDSIIAYIVQAYFPGVCNMQGVFYLPHDSAKQLLSDVLSMIPFRSTFLPIKLVDSTPRLFVEYNNAGGQILPLIGQSYYHFGYFAPILSMFFIKLALNAFNSSIIKANNYLRYMYYIYLSVFSAMMPCLYHFGVFMQTYFSSILILYFMSVINGNFKMSYKRK